MRTLALLVLTAVSTACTPTSAPPQTVATVTRVIDGDTFDISGSRVRLIGINAPEHDECFGPEATTALGDMIEGTNVTLESGVQGYDQYGRVLAYVYLDGQFINELLVARGFALSQAYPPNTGHQEELGQAMTVARQQRAGMWAPGACGTSSEAVSILEINANPPGPDEDVLNEETVTLRASSTVDLSGWVLRDGSSSHRFHFPDGYTLEGEVTVHTGCGTNTESDLFWCADGPVWGNRGDTALIYDESGALVDAVTYPPK